MAATTKRLRSAIPVLHVADVKRSIEWYRRGFGFLVEPSPNADAPVFAILAREGAGIFLQQIDGYVRPTLSRPGGVWDVYLCVRDAREEHARLAVHGATEPHETESGCLEFEVCDPDGHVIVVSQDLPDAAA